MTLDITTPEGLKAAVVWQTAHVNRIRDGGSWVIPADDTIVQVFHSKKVAHFTRIRSDLFFYVVRVFQAMGWTCLDEKDEVIGPILHRKEVEAIGGVMEDPPGTLSFSA
jgi:hypothetical protein